MKIKLTDEQINTIDNGTGYSNNEYEHAIARAAQLKLIAWLEGERMIAHDISGTNTHTSECRLCNLKEALEG